MKKRNTIFAHRIVRVVQSLHNILTRDLTWNDFNTSLSDDMRGMYEFYVRSMKSVEGEQNKVKRAIKFMWHLFVAFLLKLSPARRFMYAIAVVFILIAVSESKIASALYSFFIVNILLALELADKLITKDELSIARDIQLSLQPSGTITIPGYEFVAHSEVAKQVGGDYYDILPLPDGNTLLVIGDVSGKGISSALYVVKVQTALQLFITESSDIKDLLSRLNAHLYGQMKRNYFLSLSLVKVYKNGTIELCRAGHPPALLFHSIGKTVAWLQPTGIAVGMAPSAHGRNVGEENGTKNFECTLELQSAQLEKGDLLFLYTDGLTESVNSDGKEFGQDRIGRMISSFADESLENIRKHIVGELATHRDATDLRDDTTFVLLKRE